MKGALLAVLLLPLLALPVLAAEGELTALPEVEQVYEAAGEYGDGLEPGDGLDLDSGLAALAGRAADQLGAVVRETVGSCVGLLAVVLLCGLLAESFAPAGGDRMGVVRLVGVIAITAIALSDTGELIGLGRQTIGEMEAFSHALVPTVAALTAAAGAPAGAAAGQLASMLFSGVLVTAVDGLLLPMVYAYVACCAAAAATGNEGLRRVGGLLKWLVTAALSALLLVYVGYLTVSGVIAGSADAVTVKTAKLALSGVVPVVGGILSDAAETVLAGAGVLKSTVGLFGMLAVLAMCVVPFLQLGLHYLAYKCTGALSATVADSRLTGLIDSIGAAFGLVLGMTGACAFLLLMAMVSALSLVVR